MTESNAIAPPGLSELVGDFLARPADAAWNEAATAATGEVIPHEVTVGFRADARLAWQEGQTLAPDLSVGAPTTVTAPADWSAVALRAGSAHALPLAQGHYPQQVRALGHLLQPGDFRALRPHGVTSQGAPAGLAKWASVQATNGDVRAKLHAAGVLRAAQDFDAAEAILSRVVGAPEAVANERAALLWQRGDCEAATAMWEAQPESAAALFNLGMAYLFSHRPEPARDRLRRALGRLPEASGWYHLAALYLALAEMQG